VTNRRDFLKIAGAGGASPWPALVQLFKLKDEVFPPPGEEAERWRE